MNQQEIVRALLAMGFGHFGEPGYGATVFEADGTTYKVGASEHLRYPPVHRDPNNMHDQRGSVWVHSPGILVATGMNTYCQSLTALVAPNLEVATTPSASQRYPGWRDLPGNPAVSLLLADLPAALPRMSR